MNMHSLSVLGSTTKVVLVLLAKRALSDVLEDSTSKIFRSRGRSYLSSVCINALNYGL